LGIVKRGTEEEVAVRLVKASDEREPNVLPGLMALQEGGKEGGGKEGGRVSKCAKMRGGKGGEEVVVRLVKAREEREPEVKTGQGRIAKRRS